MTIEEAMRYAKAITIKIARSGWHVSREEKEDMNSNALLGYFEAKEKHDPARGDLGAYARTLMYYKALEVLRDGARAHGFLRFDNPEKKARRKAWQQSPQGKASMKKSQQKYRDANKEKIREYNRKRNATGLRDHSAYNNNPVNIARRKALAQTPERKAKQRESNRRYYQLHKAEAHENYLKRKAARLAFKQSLLNDCD